MSDKYRNFILKNEIVFGFPLSMKTEQLSSDHWDIVIKDSSTSSQIAQGILIDFARQNTSRLQIQSFQVSIQSTKAFIVPGRLRIPFT
jgi:hypothetical protein